MVNNDHWHERLQPGECGAFLDRLRSQGIAGLSGCHLKRE
jgi:hypothetical protein